MEHTICPEGRIFFIYDHTVLQKEEDDLKDAIIYFFPHTVDPTTQCAICGQLMGMVTLFKELFKTKPKLYKLKNDKFAVKHIDQYTMALAGSHKEMDNTLVKQLDDLYQTFAFYQASIDTVKKLCKSRERFLQEMEFIWNTYLPFIRKYDDPLLSAFHMIPTVQLPRRGAKLFLQSSHILQASRYKPGILGGCIILKNSILCNQLPIALAAKLCLVKPKQLHLPCQLIETNLLLPVGVRILVVYLNSEERKYVRPVGSQNAQTQRVAEDYGLSSVLSRTSSIQEDMAISMLKTEHEKESKEEKHSENWDAPLGRRKMDDVITFTKPTRAGNEKLKKVKDDDELVDVFEKDLMKFTDDPGTPVENRGGTSFVKGLKVEGCNTTQNNHNMNDKSENDLQVNELATEIGDQLTTYQSSLIKDKGDAPACSDEKTNELSKEAKAVCDTSHLSIEKDNVDDETKDISSLSNISSYVSPCDEITSNFETNNEAMTPSDSFPTNDNIDAWFVNEQSGLNSGAASEEAKTHESKERKRALTKSSTGSYEEIGRTFNDLSIVHSRCCNHFSNENTCGEQQFKSNEHFPVFKGCQDIGNFEGEPVSEVDNSESNSRKMNDTVIDSLNTSGGKLHINVDRSLSFNKRHLSNSSTEYQELQDEIEEESENHVGQSVFYCDCGNNGDNNCEQLVAISSHEKSSTELNLLSEDKQSLLSSSISAETNTLTNKDNLKNDVQTSLAADCDDVKHSNSEISESDIDQSLSDINHSRSDINHSKSDINHSKSDVARQSKSKSKKIFKTKKTPSQASTDEDNSLQEVRLYVQGHSDIVLLLLMTPSAAENQSLIKELWKTSVTQLADLEMQIKECLQTAEETKHVPNTYSYLNYDSFERSLQGNMLCPVSSVENDFVEIANNLHNDFSKSPETSSVTLKSHSCFVYGHQGATSETYFTPNLTPKQHADIPDPKDPNSFILEPKVQKLLQKDLNITTI
ncbi:uncharacterized protein LOC141899238 isoform X2 [Tubulanus polymorphus]|uniref:uncharacterized protein LOC141899238 isoform X2 n=1 Tax=Tubulanus polymorphus TaxID=672921 RepID=UPI003DA26139